MGFQDPLTIAHVDAESGFSGGEVQVFLLMEGLARGGHENLLLCPPGSRAQAEAERRSIPCVTVPMRGDIDLPAVLRLRNVFTRRRVDLVHLHTGRASWLGGLAAHLAERPAITTRRQDRAVRRGWRTRLLYERLTQRAVAISPAVADRLTHGGVDPARVRLIPSAVGTLREVDEDERTAARAELELGPQACCLLTMAALVRRKGIDVLLEALALDRETEGSEDTVLLVAGEGPERADLEARAQRLGIAPRVRFLGLRTDKERLLAACDLFVLPSRSEGLGVAALEAMASGRAVVASRVGGLGQAVVNGRCGRLVAPGDPAELAHALAELRADPEGRRRMGEAGRERVREQHLADGMVAAYEALYREVLAECRASRMPA